MSLMPRKLVICPVLIGRQRERADRFMGVLAGTTPVLEFFAPENLGRIIGAQA
jgi:hypothetical protein